MTLLFNISLKVFDLFFTLSKITLLTILDIIGEFLFLLCAIDVVISYMDDTDVYISFSFFEQIVFVIVIKNCIVQLIQVFNWGILYVITWHVCFLC